ncbi:hypothetical protein B4119_2337 [Parageobacillus caldoxylosilyticus]|uniref:Uncharacterized protein n=1 Tax=Saccharococcus caldoxylosilyticus TaxID=81408 RepID=A0A150LVJ6_9BACL|nr:hypothetical protein B4119_2337 [Parageobacillus caldoxylosilyticus]
MDQIPPCSFPLTINVEQQGKIKRGSLWVLHAYIRIKTAN